MNFRYYNILLCAVLATLSLFSCSDKYVAGSYIASNSKYSLNMGTNDLQNILATGGVISTRIEATSAVNWELQGLPSWLSATTSKGTGSQDVSFLAEPNESFTSSRTHIFNIVTTNDDWKLTMPVSVTQLKKAKEMSVTPSDNRSLTFDSKGGQKTLSITSNVAWTAECKETFVHLSQASATQGLNMLVSVDAYDQIDVTQNRTATIYFKDAAEGDVLQMVTITQTPLQTSISTENISIDFDQNKNSKVYTLGNISGSYSVSSDASWLTIKKNKNAGIVDITISVDANENDDDRTSKAYVYIDANKSIRYSFSVSQKGNHIEVQPSTLSYTADGGVYTVEVSTMGRWKATTQDEWITPQESSSSCRIAVATNNSLQSRTGSVVFSRINDSNEVIGRTITLPVSQQARQISSDTQTMQFGPEAADKVLSISSDASWTLSTNDSWIAFSPTSGNGDAKVTVFVSENTSSSSRTGTLYLKCLDKTIEIIITQNTAYLNTSSNSIRFDAKGGEELLSFASNVSWKLSCTESWIVCSQYEGFGDANITLKAVNNDSGKERSATIVISSVMGEYKLLVYQNNHTISLSSTDITFSREGGQKLVTVNSSQGTYSSSTENSWISISQNGNTLVVNVSANSKLAAKEGTITVSSGNISNTIRVYQDAAETPVVTITQAGSVNWAPYVKAKVDTKGTSISKCGVIMKHNYLNEVPSFTVNSNDAIKYGTLGDDGTFRVDFGQYYKSGYFFFKAFVITTDGDVVYSDVSDGIRT